MSDPRSRNTGRDDWARSPSAMFASIVLGCAALLTIGIALSREFSNGTGSTPVPLVSSASGVDAAPRAIAPGPSAIRLIDINSADLSELDLLPGIGPALGQRIIDFRNEHGPFQTIDSIQGVSGIGPRTLEKMRPLITLGDADGYTSDN